MTPADPTPSPAKPPRILPGVAVNTSAGTVLVSALARWPFDGCAWPCAASPRSDLTFHFESGGDLAQVDGESAEDESNGEQIGAMAEDCAALLALAEAGARRLARLTYAAHLESHPAQASSAAVREDWQTLTAAATAAGERAGRNAAAWIAQDTFGGRVADEREARAAASACLRAIEDGDPQFYFNAPAWSQAREVSPFAFLCETLGGDPEETADALRSLSIYDTAADLAGEIDAEASAAFASALEDEVARLARSALQ